MIDQPDAAASFFPGRLAFLLLAPVSAVLILRFRWHRLPGAPLRRPVLAPEVIFGLAALMLLLGAIGSSVAVRAFGIEVAPEWKPGLRDHAVLALGAYSGQAIVAVAYAMLLRTRSDAGSGPGGERAGRLRSIAIGAMAVLFVWPLVNAAGGVAAMVVERLGGPAPREIAHDTLQLLLDSAPGAWFVLLAALVTVAAPILEEVLYRGLLQTGMRRVGLGPWPAIMVTSVAFAAMHWDNTAPHAVVGLFVLSLGFGWAHERTGRLTTPIVMHVIFNLGNLGLALAFR